MPKATNTYTLDEVIDATVMQRELSLMDALILVSLYCGTHETGLRINQQILPASQLLTEQLIIKPRSGTPVLTPRGEYLARWIHERMTEIMRPPVTKT